MAANKPMDHERPQSLGEEIANSLSHGLGLVAVLAAMPWLLLKAVHQNHALAAAAAGVYAASVVILYLSSTLYHALAGSGVKNVFRIIDHCAIYLLIAGTYTPFTLGVLRGAWGWTLFGLVWGMAVLGILLKATEGVSHPRLSVALYLTMGWLAIVAIRPLWLRLPFPGFLLIAAGGLAYTSGLFFYSQPHRRYSHFVWHLFVLMGTSFHFLAVLRYSGL